MNSDKFSLLYQEELIALRKDARRFGTQHQEMAGRLGLDWGETPDPMVERLIESTAWLAARVRHDSQARLPFTAQQVLAKIHPHFISPVPSVGIASLQAHAGFAEGYPAGRPLAAGSRFHCGCADGGVIRWRTGWPHLLSGAAVAGHSSGERGGAWRLRLVVKNIRALPSLRLFLCGDPALTHPLHQWVHTNCTDIFIDDAEEWAGEQTPGGQIRLDADAFRPGGLAEEDLVLPTGGFPHPAYQLLREYFTCPERFLFWDFDLSNCPERRKPAAISIFLRLPPPPGVSTNHIRFDANAVPVVNLHETLAEPIRVERARHGYALEPDRSNPDRTEVHSVLELEALRPGGGAFAIPGRWHSRRCRRTTGGGSDVELFFVPPDKEDFREPFIVSARVLCTDRGRAAALGNQITLASDDETELFSAVMERPPTPQCAAPSGGDELWKLVAAMTLRHRELSGGDGLTALKNILRTFIPEDCRGALAQTEGVTALECRDTLAPLRASRLLPMGGAMRGHAFTMHLDPSAFTTGSPFLFASVIESFLALFAGAHSFTQLTACSGGEKLHSWPPRTGRRRL